MFTQTFFRNFKAVLPSENRIDIAPSEQETAWIPARSARCRGAGRRLAAVEALRSLGARLDDAWIPGRAARRRGIVRSSTCCTTRRQPCGAEALREIVGRLHDEDWKVRRAAVETLGSAGVRLDAEALREIAGRLRDAEWRVRDAAVQTLRALSARLDAAVLREIIRLLQDRYTHVRSGAVEVLRSLGPRLDNAAVRKISNQTLASGTRMKR